MSENAKKMSSDVLPNHRIQSEMSFFCSNEQLTTTMSFLNLLKNSQVKQIGWTVKWSESNPFHNLKGSVCKTYKNLFLCSRGQCWVHSVSKVNFNDKLSIFILTSNSINACCLFSSWETWCDSDITTPPWSMDRGIAMIFRLKNRSQNYLKDDIKTHFVKLFSY